MNYPFQARFEKKVRDAGFIPVKRGDDTLWRRPDERGILYDLAEAVTAVMRVPKK